MPLINREHPFPPGGYVFFQPQTNWYSSPGLTFYQTRDEIVAHRKKNPRFAATWSVDPEAVANELDYYTCLRIHFNPQYCTDQVGGGVKKNSLNLPRSWPRPIQVLADAAGAAATRVSNAAAGVGVVIDWLGDSLEPVAPELSSARAEVCAKCPLNQDPDWLQKLEGWIAADVKSLSQLKNDLKLTTPYDARLFYCQGCDCSLDLKVHVKLEHIAAHTSDKVKARLDPGCWILSELAAVKS